MLKYIVFVIAVSFPQSLHIFWLSFCSIPKYKFSEQTLHCSLRFEIWNILRVNFDKMPLNLNWIHSLECYTDFFFLTMQKVCIHQAYVSVYKKIQLFVIYLKFVYSGYLLNVLWPSIGMIWKLYDKLLLNSSFSLFFFLKIAVLKVTIWWLEFPLN